MTCVPRPGLAPEQDVVQTRSCQKCNQRKTRCSKSRPWSSCLKLGVECVFPPPGRAPRRKKRALKAELVSRVKDLEQRIQQIREEEQSTQSSGIDRQNLRYAVGSHSSSTPSNGASYGECGRPIWSTGRCRRHESVCEPWSSLEPPD